MYKKVGNLTFKSIIASILVLATVFVYVIGDNFSFMAYFKDDKTVENTFFDTGYDGLRSVSDLTLAETGTEMGKIGEDLSSGFEKLVSDCSNKKTFSSGKSEFIELVSDLKNRSLSEIDSTNNGTEEYEKYRAVVASGFEEIEDYAAQLNEDNSEEILGKIEETVNFEQPYVGLADDLPFSNVAVDEVQVEKYVPERSASSYTLENTEYSPADLEFTNDAVINDEIRTEFADYATTLEVYQYIKNNYMPEFYYGSRKGSVGAFEEKAGNDYDLSSLLIAVLRDRNIPARYVRGNIEITAEQAIQWTGAEDINSAARIIAALGIPVTTLTSENGIVAIRLEHVWVEAYVPYTDYRGAGNNAGDSLWIPLDVSFKKMKHYDGIDLTSLDDYISDENNFLTAESTINGVSVENLSTLVDGESSAFVRYLLENGYGDSSLAEIYGGKDIVYEDLGYLPLTLPYNVSETIDSFDDIPLDLTDSVSFSLYGNSVYVSESFGTATINQTFYTPDLYGKRMILAYAPASDADSNILDQYGDIFSTPAYLLKLKPQLIVDGEVVAEGSVCNAGYSQNYTIKIHNASPQKSDSTVENSVVVGAMYCVAIDYGTISAGSLERSQNDIDSFDSTLSNLDLYTDQVMGKMLDATAKTYFVQLDIYNYLAAGQSNVCATRDLSVGIVGFGVNVVYTFDRPSELNEGGIFLDIGHDVHSVISYDNNTDNEKKYMLQTGIYASAMEHGVLEQITGIESISTIKVLQYATSNNIPIHTVTKNNLSSEINVLNVSENVKKEIRSAVNSGKMVVIPEEEITINQWSGVGYMVLDTDTCSCGYMISGGLAGGMMSAKEVLAEYGKELAESLYHMVCLMANITMIFLIVAFVCPMALPAVMAACKAIMIAAGYLFVTLAGISIGAHFLNYAKTNDIGEYQRALIELATLCTLVYAGEKLGEKLKSDSATEAGEEMAEACKEGTCFVAGTLVSTPTGLVPIEDVKAGDIVLSFNEKTLEVSEQVVEKTFERESNELVKITVGDEIIKTTPEHPFYMPKKGFVDAIDLRAGDSLWTVNGECVIIEKIQHEILESHVKVYNFRVSHTHTYFVGSKKIGVHNANYVEPNPDNPQDLAKYYSDLINSIKSKLNGKSGGNVGGIRGKVSVDGEIIDVNMDAYSKKGNVEFDPETGKFIFKDGKLWIRHIVDKFVKYPENPSFNEIVQKIAPKNGGAAFWRYNCSECKLIENLNILLKGDPLAAGDIDLVTDLDPCDSCKGVIEAFSERYPNIKITVADGFGDIYTVQDGVVTQINGSNTW